ncbi:hypothetical protein PENCOP_c005G03501 [Penicillium coprophilum]|uniref:Uncharacterized protein n=1 Tax=Penicillium coprophilum TaxID=36646 RepID=A0A1V6USF0_9EURO|nr:hypothetical protein PENCOP_c005G03501 [Penicillium coprophilum]
MAIFVVFDEPPEEAVGSLIAEVVEETELVAVEEAVLVDVREDGFEFEGVVDGVAGVPVDVSYVKSVREGHESDPLERILKIIAGSTKLDDSDSKSLFCPPAVVVKSTSWVDDTTSEVSMYFDVLETGVSGSPSTVPNIANGKNLIAGMIG